MIRIMKITFKAPAIKTYYFLKNNYNEQYNFKDIFFLIICQKIVAIYKYMQLFNAIKRGDKTNGYLDIAITTLLILKNCQYPTESPPTTAQQFLH